MDLEVMLTSLSQRAPWLGAGRLILKSSGFTIHRGYKLTIEAALDEPADEVRNGRLERLLTEHAISGEKLIRVIRLQPAERTRVLQWIQAKRKSTNALTQNFPALAGENQLPQFAASDPISVGSVDLENGVAAVYTAIRSYQDRVEIHAADLRAGVNDGYEHIYAIKRVFRQTFDAIWLPAGRDFVCLLADFPLGVPSGFAQNSQTFLEVQLRRFLGRTVTPVNLWPAIDGLYKVNSGRLVDHGFVNNAEAVKSHTARRGGRSLRDDPYDAAGALAVGEDLLTYKVAVAWPRPIEGATKAQPEVILPGTAQMLEKMNLNHFVARNCISARDLDFVTLQVMGHIGI